MLTSTPPGGTTVLEYARNLAAFTGLLLDELLRITSHSTLPR